MADLMTKFVQITWISSNIYSTFQGMEIYFRGYKTNELQYESCEFVSVYINITFKDTIHHPVLSDVPTNITKIIT